MELDQTYVWITTRRLRPGARDEFSRAWRPSALPEGMLRSDDRHAALFELRDPAREVVSAHGKRHMAWADPSVRRNHSALHRGRCRVEDEQHRVTALEEHVPVLRLGIELELQDRRVERFRLAQ